MKTDSLREVKNNLSRVIEELPTTGPSAHVPAVKRSLQRR